MKCKLATFGNGEKNTKKKPSTTIKSHPFLSFFKTITDFTALFLDLPNSTRPDNSNFVFPFDSFVYVRSRDGWHAGETIDTCPACETFLLFDDSYAVTPPRLRLLHLRPPERVREREIIPSRVQPLLLTPSLIVQNSICPFATLISRSRGQDFEQDWRILENIRSERGGGFFSSGGSKNMGCTSVRGEKRWMRGEDPLWNVR